MKIFPVQYFLLAVMMILPQGAAAQTFNEDRVILSNYLQRQYENEEYEGARIVDDYENSYVVTAVALMPEKYDSESAMKRVAYVKGQRAISEFINGSTISSTTIYQTERSKEEGGKEKDVVKALERTRQHSVGTVQNVELYASFKFKDKYVSIYAYKLESKKKRK